MLMKRSIQLSLYAEGALGSFFVHLTLSPCKSGEDGQEWNEIRNVVLFSSWIYPRRRNEMKLAECIISVQVQLNYISKV